jgi:hypothetical protein
MLNANDNLDRDRRGAVRHRVLMGGKVAWTDNHLSGDCTIRDLSDDGARVELSSEALPRHPILIVTRSGLAHEARTTWTHGRMAGLKFINTYDLNAAVPPQLQHLRRLWVEKLPR